MYNEIGESSLSQKKDDQELCNQCENPCRSGDKTNVDGKELAVDVKDSPSWPSDDMNAVEILSREELLKTKAHQDLSKVILWDRIALLVLQSSASTMRQSF